MAPEQPQRKPKTALRLWLLVVRARRIARRGLAPDASYGPSEDGVDRLSCRSAASVPLASAWRT